MKSLSEAAVVLSLLCILMIAIVVQTISWMLLAVVPPVLLINFLITHFGQDGVVTNSELGVISAVALPPSCVWAYFVGKVSHQMAEIYKIGFEEISKFIKDRYN